MKRRTFMAITGAGALSAAGLGRLPDVIAAPTKTKKAAPSNPKAKSKKASAQPTVAVLYFDYSGKDPELGVLKKGLAQILISDLSSNPGIQLIERTRLESVMAELKLSGSRKVDKKTAARIGKLLGAQYLILGSYFSLMGSLRIDARLVAVETGYIVLSTGANGKIDEFLSIQGKVAQALGAQLSKGLPARTAKSSPKSGMKRPSTRRKRRPKRSRPRRPRRLHTRTALRYAKALDAKDRGDEAAAKAHLTAVLKEQPDFELARRDLAIFVQ